MPPSSLDKQRSASPKETAATPRQHAEWCWTRAHVPAGRPHRTHRARRGAAKEFFGHRSVQIPSAAVRDVPPLPFRVRSRTPRPKSQKDLDEAENLKVLSTPIQSARLGAKA